MLKYRLCTRKLVWGFKVLLPAKDLSQFFFCIFQYFSLMVRQVVSCAVDIEVKHRHSRLIRGAFPSMAPGSRTLERARNCCRVFLFEYAFFKVKRVTRLRDLCAPLPLLMLTCTIFSEFLLWQCVKLMR